MAKKLQINHERTLKDLTAVGKTVMPLIKQLLGANGLVELELLRNWQNIVGSELAQWTLPKKITFPKDERHNGCLSLTTLSGAFAMEVKQRESQILQKLNTFLGYPAVNKLKIIQTGNPEDFLTAKKPIENLKKIVVSESEQNYITQITKDIQSDELREKLQSLGQAVLRKNKKEEN